MGNAATKSPLTKNAKANWTMQRFRYLEIMSDALWFGGLTFPRNSAGVHAASESLTGRIGKSISPAGKMISGPEKVTDVARKIVGVTPPAVSAAPPVVFFTPPVVFGARNVISGTRKIVFSTRKMIFRVGKTTRFSDEMSEFKRLSGKCAFLAIF